MLCLHGGSSAHCQHCLSVLPGLHHGWALSGTACSGSTAGQLYLQNVSWQRQRKIAAGWALLIWCRSDNLAALTARLLQPNIKLPVCVMYLQLPGRHRDWHPAGLLLSNLRLQGLLTATADYH